AFPSSYIPTATAAATRAEDLASNPTFSQYLRATGSTACATWDSADVLSTNSRVFAVDDGSGNNQFVLRTNNGQAQGFVNSGGATTLTAT
ncbi:hypothetical protein ABK046_46895, partial [Streptomyces caeruleatus]